MFQTKRTVRDAITRTRAKMAARRGHGRPETQFVPRRNGRDTRALLIWWRA
jgi:hypothetical protein